MGLSGIKKVNFVYFSTIHLEGKHQKSKAAVREIGCKRSKAPQLNLASFFLPLIIRHL